MVCLIEFGLKFLRLAIILGTYILNRRIVIIIYRMLGGFNERH